jgi:hypothetical protein
MMDNERTTPEGDGDDPLRELDQLESVCGELDATSRGPRDRAVPSSYGAPGGLLDKEEDQR